MYLESSLHALVIWVSHYRPQLLAGALMGIPLGIVGHVVVEHFLSYLRGRKQERESIERVERILSALGEKSSGGHHNHSTERLDPAATREKVIRVGKQLDEILKEKYPALAGSSNG